MALVLTSAGCGDDTDEAGRATRATPTPTARPTPTASPGSQIQVAGLVANYHGTADVDPGGKVTIDLAGDHFQPTVLRGGPGQRISLTLRNSGETPHHFSTADQQLIVEVQPGLTAEGRITLPRSGNLSFFCQTHREDGMAGAFNVSGPIEAPDPKASPTATGPAHRPDEGPTERGPHDDRPHDDRPHDDRPDQDRPPADHRPGAEPSAGATRGANDPDE